jgi:hypothetical protein
VLEAYFSRNEHDHLELRDYMELSRQGKLGRIFYDLDATD